MSLGELIAIVGVVIGVFFSVVGVIGMIRLPDVYTRIHASGKVSTLGLFGVLLATAALQPEQALKAVVLFVFLLLTAPVASHAIASAAHRQGVARENCARDDLATRQSQIQQGEG